MNNLDKKYQQLLSDIIEFGVQKKDRTGTGTISEFGHQIRHKMSEGFPLLTTKKMAFKTMVTELLWFLKGDTNIKYLVDNGCHIWDGDAYKNYLKECKRLNIIKVDTPVVKIRVPIPYTQEELINKIKTDDEFAKTWGELGKIRVPIPYTQEEFINKIKTDDEFAMMWGELGPVYGRQWRSWETYNNDQAPWNNIDQIQNLINELKTNPDSRRLIVNSWNVGELSEMILPPCHYSFQVYTRELSLEERLTWMKNNKTNVVLPARDPNVKFSMDEFFRPYGVPKRAISLMFNMRSTDVGLGLGFNLASYGLLLMMIAKQVDMIPDELIYNGGDVHLYLNHIEPIKEQLTRESYDLPTVKISDRVVNDISEYTLDDFTLENYQYHPTIRMPLSN